MSQSLFTKITGILVILLIIFPTTVRALSPEQQQIYNSGINFFDADTGNSTCNLDSTLTGNSNTEQAFNYFVGKGLTPLQAAAISGNFYYESGGMHPEITNNIGAHGIAQWLGARLDGLKQLANQRGTDGNDLATQLDFAWQELTSYKKPSLDTLKQEADISKAVTDFESTYEVSGDTASYPKRIGDAVKILKLYGSGVTDASSGADTSQPTCIDGSASDSLGSVDVKKLGTFGTADGLMGHQPTMIGLHYTARNEQTVQDVISDLQDASGAKHCNHITHSCSVQLTVLPDGSIYQLTSRLDVRTENIINFNDADIGIEIAGQDQQTLLANQKQYTAVVSLVAQLMQKYNIKMQQDFLNKAGLMGHMECDSWSDSHIGTSFLGQYSGQAAIKTDGHTDPGATYMSKVRAAVSSQLGQ